MTEKMRIRSLYGDYEVLFDDRLDLNEVITPGDIVVIDHNVYELYKTHFRKELCDENTIVVTASEEQKSYETVIPVIEQLITQGFHKNNSLIAIGGGITQDIVAFIASILYRGVKWKFIPTTLLAQCDSCIGSKTSINFMHYKNQLGGFYPPRAILISSVFLDSLSEKEIKSGLGEMLHYYVVGGEADFTFFENNYIQALTDAEKMQSLIRRSLEIKKNYVEIDEFDRKERQIFNYGHSFGHALESVTGYAIPHGIAVSYGIDMANYVAEKRGMLLAEKRQRIRRVAEHFWKRGELDKVSVNELMDALKKDKKNVDDKLGLILCSDYGELKKCMIDPDAGFVRTLEEWFSEKSDLK